tara:strand:+ start:148 stop:453 length:306 start_codon:yes stop_codon:yes gene_type:complete
MSKEDLTRICRNCRKITKYKTELTYYYAERSNKLCRDCGREEGKRAEGIKINKFILILREKGLSKIKEEEDRIINKLKREYEESNKQDSRTDTDSNSKAKG